MKLSAMPSPRGTNREKLYILGGHKLALDAMPDDDSDDPVGAVVSWARENCDAEGRKRLIAGIQKLDEAQDDLGEPGKPAKPGAMDGGKISRLNDLKLFPDTNRLNSRRL